MKALSSLQTNGRGLETKMWLFSFLLLLKNAALSKYFCHRANFWENQILQKMQEGFSKHN